MGRFSEQANKANNTFQTTGQQIMALADIMRPLLVEELKKYHDVDDKSFHPAQIRGIALIAAQHLIKTKKSQAA